MHHVISCNTSQAAQSVAKALSSEYPHLNFSIRERNAEQCNSDFVVEFQSDYVGYKLEVYRTQVVSFARGYALAIREGA